MSRIFKYKKGYATVVEMPRPPGAKRKQKWLYGKTRQEVQEKLTELRYLLQTDQYIDETNITVKAYLRQWYESKKPDLSANTQYSYNVNIEKHVIPYIGNIKLKNVTPLQIKKLYTTLRESGRVDGKGGLSSTSVNYVHRTIRQAFAAAKRIKLIREDPMEGVPAPKIEKKQLDEAAGVLTENGIVSLLRSFQGNRLEIPLYLAATMGLRRGEILGLKWDKIDIENKLLYVHRAVSYTKEHGLQIKEPKSEEGYRTLPMPDEITALLEKHQAWQQSNKEFFGSKYVNKAPFDDLVVCKDNGEPYLPGSFSHTVGRAIQNKHLPNTTLQMLRHSYATLLLKYRTDIKIVSSLLGHAKTAFTQDTYQHTLGEMKVEVSQKISSRLFKKISND